MHHPDQSVVTGAVSFTGRYVAKRLLDQGARVRTLTRNPGREDPLGGRMLAAPLEFSESKRLRRSMRGAGVLYNTYWIRLWRGWTFFEQAVENSEVKFEAVV